MSLSSYSGVVYKVDGSGDVDPGVQVAVYNENTGDKAAQIISNHLGQYTFSGLLNGTYRIRFYGSSHNSTTESFLFTVYDPDQIVIPDAITLPLVYVGNGATLNVSESGDFLDGNLSFSNPSVASISGSNIDVTQGVVTQIYISYRALRTSITDDADKYYDGLETSTSNQWIPLGIKNVDMPVGNNQVFTMLYLPGIPVSEEETLYYEFRAQFLNGDGIPGTIGSPHETLESGSTITWEGTEHLTVQGNEWSTAASSLIGRKATFLQGSIFRGEGVAYKSSSGGTKLHFYFPANPIAQFGSFDTVSYIEPGSSTAIYDITSSSGSAGVDFNGLNDLLELVEVRDLAGTVSNSLYALQWSNYKNITGIFASGSGTTSDPHTVTLPYADGETRSTTHLQLNAITSYQVYLFISSDGSGPTYEYPIGYKNNTLQTTGEDDHGQWYLAQEIFAPAIGYTEYPNIELLLPVPAGQQVAIWVGARTSVIHGDTGAANNPFTGKGSAVDGVPPLMGGSKGGTGDPPIIT